MLKNLTIRTKTALGFGLILLVMASIVTFAIRGLQSSSDSFKTYRRLARSSVLSGRVQANMLMASKAAKDFLKSRDEKHLEIYDQRFKTAQKFALEQQATMEDPQRRELSGILVDKLQKYHRGNQDAFELMRRRDSILQQKLNPQGIRMRKNLSEILDSANRDGDSEAAYLAGRTLEDVLLGRLYVFKFLDENKDADVERVRAELGEGFEEAFDKIASAIDDPRRKELLQDFSAARESYLAAFEEMVLIIQQRNALISQDVQPLDQSIADVSEEIKLSLKADQDDLGPSVQQSNTATVRAVLIGSLLAVGLAILIAWLFVRTINRSVKALGSSEAETERLSREIRARKESEEQLRESEERFDLTVRGSGDGLWDHNPATGELWYADRFRELLGYSSEEEYPNVVESWSNGLHPDDREATLDAFGAHLESNVPYDVEYRLETKTGEYRWFRARGISLRDETGRSYRAAGSIADITDQKQAEEELRQSEERFDLTVRGSGDGLWDHDPATGEMWFSDRFRELLGYGNETEYPNVAESWSNGLHPDDREATLQAFASHLEKDVPYDVEYRLKTQSCEYRWYRARGISLRDDAGRSYRAAGSITDITEQKQAEEELRQSEERFDLTVRGSGDGLWDHDPATGEMWFSDRFRELLGYSNEMEYPNVAESWSDGLHPDDREATLQAFASHLEKDVPYDVEYRLRTKTGEYRWYRARGISLRDETDRSFRAAGSITDTTNQKQAEQALAASEERSRLLLESAPDGMMIADAQARIAMVNAQFEVLFGFTKEEIIGQRIEVLLPERFRAKHVGQRDGFFVSPSVREMGSDRELYARRRDGSEFPVEISLSPLQTDEGILVLSSIRDITERKQAEAELIEARTAAEAANQAKSDFLANMSHEIRTPMNGIMGMTELALGTDLSKEQREFLTTIESSADSLLSLINDILDFSKIEAKRLELDSVNFELRERIGDTLSTLAVRAHDKGLELVFDVDPEVPESLVGDVHRIRQILVNLLGNAIKFTEQGEIVLRIELASQVEQRVTLRFAVKDTGIGLPPEKMETIFQPFEQADVSTTRKYGGTGLGLAICVRLVELMGGEMNVESQLGVGTTFSFTADLGIGSQPPATHAATRPIQLRGLSGMRVLVIDDNETNRRILAKMLENWGMESVVVDSAAKGLQALQESLDDQPIGLVLSDVNMPEMDGFMFAQQVKDHQALQNTPIILLTSANRSGDSARCRQLGIAAHLIKPARQSFLFDAIATSVGIGDAEEKTSNDGAVVQQRDLAQQGLQLLLAEDNATNQKFAVRSLTKAGHTVIVANNGHEAVELWAADSFDAVLMDIQMPVMDGYDATAEIRRRESSSERHTPIIAMTAHAMKGDKEKCLEAGMDGYVTKPIKTKLMLAEIARVLEEFPPQSDSVSREEFVDDRRV